MSINDSISDPLSSLTDLPTFDLSYMVDDENEPAHVIVHSERDDEIDTYWVSVDLEHAVDLADVA